MSSSKLRQVGHCPVLRRLEAEAGFDVSRKTSSEYWSGPMVEGTSPLVTAGRVACGDLTPLTLVQAIAAGNGYSNFLGLSFMAQVGLSFLDRPPQSAIRRPDWRREARPIVALRAMYAIVEKRRFKSKCFGPYKQN